MYLNSEETFLMFLCFLSFYFSKQLASMENIQLHKWNTRDKDFDVDIFSFF